MLALLLALSLTAADAPPATISIVPPSVVAQFLGQPGLTIVDLNPPELFVRGHLPGARNVATLDELPGALPARRDADVVFYCSGPDCGRAEAASREAARLGYTSLFVMEDGIEGWMGERWPTVAGPSHP